MFLFFYLTTKLLFCRHERHIFSCKKLFTFMKHRIFGNSVVSFCTKQNTNSWIVILAFYKVVIHTHLPDILMRQ